MASQLIVENLRTRQQPAPPPWQRPALKSTLVSKPGCTTGRWPTSRTCCARAGGAMGRSPSTCRRPSRVSTSGRQNALATSSCTAAMHLALRAAGVGPGDEVIVPAFTYVSTAIVAVYCGAAAGVRRHRSGDADALRRDRGAAALAAHPRDHPDALRRPAGRLRADPRAGRRPQHHRDRGRRARLRLDPRRPAGRRRRRVHRLQLRADQADRQQQRRHAALPRRRAAHRDQPAGLPRASPPTPTTAPWRRA